VRFGLEQTRELRLVAADHARAHHADVPHAPALAVTQHGEVERHALTIVLDDLRLHDGAVAVHRVTGDHDLLALVTVEVPEIRAVQQLAEECDERTPLALAERLPVRAERTAAHLVPVDELVRHATDGLPSRSDLRVALEPGSPRTASTRSICEASCSAAGPANAGRGGAPSRSPSEKPMITVVETRGMGVTSTAQRLQGECRTLISGSYGTGVVKGCPR